MTPEHPNERTPRVGPPARLAGASARQPRARKGRPNNLTPIKLLIGAASVAATVGGWGLLARHDAALADPDAGATDVAALVQAATPTATILPELTATPIPLVRAAPATATTETSLATATAEPAQPTAEPAQPTATEPAPPTATAAQAGTAPPTAVATTRSPLTRTRSSR
jgi:cytoskeleton protein RodZ